ncbi:hypothetical protein EV359DRAFT_40092 [Lentinula novae-zelandiae]|nr:hypothetical protein EV359DRAFT_40092 [Lentinula novae-zelandiae]
MNAENYWNPSANSSAVSRPNHYHNPLSPSYRPNAPNSHPQQPRLRMPARTGSMKEQDAMIKVEKYLRLISDEFGSLGGFLHLLFWCRKKKDAKDKRSDFHQRAVAQFLQGQSSITFAHILKQVYNHRSSYPGHRSKYKHERAHSFSLSHEPIDLHSARIAISCFSAHICSHRAHYEVGTLLKNDSNHPEDAPARMTASGASADMRWSDITEWSPRKTAATFKRRARFISDLLVFAMTHVEGGTEAERKNRPTDMLLISALNPVIIGRNKLANGYLSMPLGVHQFASQAHIDEKRVLSALGLATSDTTVRNSLRIMSQNALQSLRNGNIKAAESDEIEEFYIFDNIQQHALVREAGALRQSVMKVGCAATSIRFHKPLPPGAFDLADYLSRVTENKRSTMTTESLFDSIDWVHLNDLAALHWLLPLVSHVSSVLGYHTKTIHETMRADPIAVERVPDEPTVFHPLCTNAEQEIETQGFVQCVRDFDTQEGYVRDDLVELIGGDGASFETALRAQKYLAPTSLNNRESMRNKIPLPELWHTKDTALKTISENHFGPLASSDPSSMSKLFGIAGLKRPPNLKKPDHYPTSDGLKLVWVAQVLDCWRIHLKTDDLQVYFENLKNNAHLPTFDELLRTSAALVQKYGTMRAYRQVLTSEYHSKSPTTIKIDADSTWYSPTVTNSSDEHSMDNTSPKDCDKFDGDRCLANSILFKFQFGTWMFLDYAIRDGDIGIVMRLLKIWIFMFAGSSHQKYVSYMLELNCLLEYETSPALRTLILQNYLVKIGFVCKERDLLQEHHNKKLEAMVEKSGGNFDDSYYREVISPNVDKFIHVLTSFESAFEQQHRSNKHTSPVMHPELKILLLYLKTSKLHLFQTTRTYNHIAMDLLSDGYDALDGGKLNTFIKKTTSRSCFIEAIENEKRRVDIGQAFRFRFHRGGMDWRPVG